jgi:hypothetical protein
MFESRKKMNKTHRKMQVILFLALLVSVLAASTASAMATWTTSLTIAPSLHGQTNPTNGTTTVNFLDQINVTATPDSGYKLSYWILDGTIYLANNPFVLNADKDHTLQPIFALVTSQNEPETTATTTPSQTQTVTPAPTISASTTQTTTPQPTNHISPTQSTSTPTPQPTQNSMTIPVAVAVVILCIAVSGLVITKVKHKPT